MLRGKFIIVLFLLVAFPAAIRSQVVTDADGNVYSTVMMGKQEWMAENLRTSRFNDNKEIPFIKNNNDWKMLRTPGYCWLENDAANRDVYGCLYNWYAVSTKKLCPKGWHVPSAGEWDVLVAFLGGDENAGFLLKEKGDEHWKNSLARPNNDYGFTALPGGMRLNAGNFPSFARSYCVWWTSTGDLNKNLAWNRGLFFSSNRIYKGNESMRNGFSVRCIKDQ